MSTVNELLDAYRELHALTLKAQSSLETGLDLAVLTPIFERKEQLNARIQALGVPDTDTTVELLQSLLAAQMQAGQSEAALVQALQPFVSSIKTLPPWKGASPESQTGKKWDLSG